MTNARPTAAPADRPWLTAGLLGLLTFLVFLPAVRCGFVDWDDDVYVTDNPLVLGGLTAEGVRGAFTSVVFHNWAPLTILSYQLDTTLFGRDPWGFHLTNVVIHAVSAGLLASVLFRMTGRMAASLLAATLFAIHIRCGSNRSSGFPSERTCCASCSSCSRSWPTTATPAIPAGSAIWPSPPRCSRVCWPSRRS